MPSSLLQVLSQVDHPTNEGAAGQGIPVPTKDDLLRLKVELPSLLTRNRVLSSCGGV